MKNQKITESIMKLISETSNVKTAKARQLCKKEVNRLKDKYTLNTVVNYLTIYKREMNKVTPSLSPYLSVGKTNLIKRKKAAKKNENKRGSNQKRIKNYEGLINKALGLLDSDKYQDIAIGLCILTGRRITEVLKTAKFTNYGKRSYMLNFQGQLKKKEKFGKISIYALGDSAEKCKAALKRLREILNTKNLSIDSVSNKYNSSVNVKVNVYVNEFIEGSATCHGLRAIYARICVLMYLPNNMNENVFLSQILGHNWDNTDMANAYKRYYI